MGLFDTWKNKTTFALNNGMGTTCAVGHITDARGNETRYYHEAAKIPEAMRLGRYLIKKFNIKNHMLSFQPEISAIVWANDMLMLSIKEFKRLDACAELEELTASSECKSEPPSDQ